MIDSDQLAGIGKMQAQLIRGRLDPGESVQLVLSGLENLIITDRQVLKTGAMHGVEAWPWDTVTRIEFGSGWRQSQVEIETIKDPARPEKRHIARVAGNARNPAYVARVALASAFATRDLAEIASARLELDRLSGVVREPISRDGSSDDLVAITCATCGAGIVGPPTATSYACIACGGRYLLCHCPQCSVETHMSTEALGKDQVCVSCGRKAKWSVWAASATTLGQVSSSLRLPPEEAADADRRSVSGVGISATGFAQVGRGTGCSLVFNRDAVTLRALEPNGEWIVVATIPLDEVTMLQVGGPGAQSNTSGGGWSGGGFGAKGIVEGVLIAGALNALTQRTKTTIETVVTLRAGSRELSLLNSSVAPEALQVVLRPTFIRIEAAQAKRSIADAGRQDQPRRGLVEELEGLVALRDQGILTTDEFQVAKAAALRAYQSAP